MYKIYTRQKGIGHTLYHKIGLIMRLTTIILILSLMQVSAATLAQRLTLNQQNTPLKSVLKEIRKQTGYDIVYENKTIKNDQTVTVKVNNATVEETLNIALNGLDLKYQIEGKTISITKKTLIENIINRFQAIDIKGKVVDSLGNGLPGATISVKGGKNSTSADAGGNFSLRNVEENSIIVISFLGYVNKEISVSKEFNYITLRQSESKLDEVKIMAYGTTTQRFSTSNIGKISSKDIEKQPITNILLALQGRVSGIVIQPINGISGGAVRVRIQGQGSIGNGNDPFFVIDGVPFNSQNLSTTTGGTYGILGNDGSGGGFGSPFNLLSPSDIESIEVLKSADATSIYGSRAANGAILITTKQGKIGKATTNFNVQMGASQVANHLELLNTQQYLEMRREAYKNDGVSQPTNPDANTWDVVSWDKNRYTDWQKTLLGGTANFTNVNGTITGGTATAKYLFGGNYQKDGSVFDKNFSNRRGGVFVKFNSTSLNNKFRFQVSSNYNTGSNNLPVLDYTQTAINLPPNAPALYDGNGHLNWENGTFDNPLTYSKSQYQSKNNSLLASGTASYNIFDGLDIRSSFGFNRTQVKEFVGFPGSSINPQFLQYYIRSATYTESTVNSWNIEPQITYSKKIGASKFDFLLGSTFLSSNGEGSNLKGEGYLNDAFLEDIKSAQVVTVNFTDNRIYKYNAFFTRLSYTLDDTYIVNLTARRDGSSRFGARNQFQNFGSVGAAWIFSNFESLKERLPFLSFGKLRASVGTTGNDQIPNYSYLGLYDSINFGIPYQGANGLELSPLRGLNNPYIQWETTTKYNLGLDAAFFSDKISLSIDYYRNKSSNQLIGYSLPVTTGFNTITSNFPATVENTSWELNLASTNLKSSNFSWLTNLNLTVPKNRLVSFPDLQQSSYASTLVVGQPLSVAKLYRFAGVNSTTGLYQFQTASGQVTSTPNPGLDKTTIFNDDPKFYGGFQNTLNYKNWSLDFLFQFVKRTGVDYSYYGFASFPGRFSVNGNQPASLIDRWRNPGDNSPIQRVSQRRNSPTHNAYNRLRESDAGITDLSYLKLRNISLSYRLPEGIAKKLRLTQCRFIVQGQNLLTVTKYKGLDPETGSAVLPPLRTITAGLNLTF